MKNIVNFASVLAMASSVNATPAQANAVCCNALTKTLPGIVYAPSSPDYDRLINHRWSNTAILHPGCVVTPKAAEDVSKAIKIIVNNQCQFAVKSGGHNANAGFNSIDDGVSIDLSTLNAAYLSTDRSYVSLGAGVTWGQAYDTFNDSGIGFTGGTCEDVGVGGVSLGGGESLFPASRGWAVDNILRYQVVLASGEIVVANETHYPDLFRSLKGGNTNFGVVTRVDLETFPFKGLWGGEVVTGLNAPGANGTDLKNRIAQATVDFTANNYRDWDTAMQLIWLYQGSTGAQVVDTFFANTKQKENPKAIQTFLDLPHQVKNTVKQISLADFVHNVSKFTVAGFREVTATLTTYNDYTTLREIWEASDAIYNALPQKDNIDWMISFIPQPKIQQAYAYKHGGNSLGLENVQKDQVVFWMLTRWTDPSLDTIITEARDKFVDVATAIAKKHNTYHPWLYINYATPKQDPLCGYGTKNVAFLKQTAKKYDPNGVFQNLLPGGFKLKNAKCA
ncbi:FAD-dependent monooxygenase sdcF [Cladobotryum mycophilum]|uniref:FAD-dependent monooxygenase sdcF n=1 Tax=Cladobotryum mycophilum TaxID=491253 RepID=A0ABR0T101_9HYPO